MCDVCRTHGLKSSGWSFLKGAAPWVGLGATWGVLGTLLTLSGPVGWVATAVMTIGGGSFVAQHLLAARRSRKIAMVQRTLHPEYCETGLKYLADHEPARLNAAYASAVTKSYEDTPTSASKHEVRRQQEQQVRKLEDLLSRHVRRGTRTADVAAELALEKQILSHLDSGDRK